MQKAAPSVGRILLAVGFALSCFGLLLFLWVAFGGPVPLKPKSYRINAYFPEAIQLAQESDVRIGGVSVGKVKAIELAPPDVRLDGQDLTEAEIEIEPEFAPISDDARAILRQKTLLGETYVELTSGTRPNDGGAPVSLGAAANNTDAEVASVESLPEGGTLPVGQTRNQVQIDEIFNALDEQTRVSFQRWQQNAAVAIQDRGLDLNDSFGNLGPFLTDASDVLALLRRQKQELKGLVRDTGEVFEALTERDQELAGVITNSNDTFDALASEEQALRETFQIFPTFQRETRATLERLDRFQENTLPLVRDLQPVADDITPTLRSVRRLSPSLSSLFSDLDDLVRASRRGLPALADFLEGTRPLLDALDPFLANLNPVVDYLEFYRTHVTDFLSNPSVGLAGTLTPQNNQPASRFTLRQLGYITEETLALYQNRAPTNRGNGYLRPLDLIVEEEDAARFGGFPSFDCNNTGDGERLPGDGGSPPVGVTRTPTGYRNYASCWLPRDFPGRFGGDRAPQVTADSAP
jgi:phospholipid/cholesterol/gamma-HCH transport system substrate-binding protein